VALTPLSWIFGGVSAARNRAYDRGTFATHASRIPVVSVGNLSVGGTGKTPVASWLARELCARGAHPAIVMRGYGEDEPLVHQLLTPDVPVYAAPDRVTLIEQAAFYGATVAILDDGFQHRRAGRSADIVLLSADQWPEAGTPALLPAGPFREPLGALRRAALIVVTAKAASADAIARVRAAAAEAAPDVPVAVVTLALGDLVDAVPPAGVAPRRLPLTTLAGQPVQAIAGIGAPSAFFAQLREVGAVVDERPFPDHHHFAEREVAELASRARKCAYTVTTLKDAVRLAPQWPAKGRSLWYVSQAVTVNDGMPFIEALISDILSDT
jgi:tetraacyldisaccharide 4'-kinase